MSTVLNTQFSHMRKGIIHEWKAVHPGSWYFKQAWGSSRKEGKRKVRSTEKYSKTFRSNIVTCGKKKSIKIQTRKSSKKHSSFFHEDRAMKSPPYKSTQVSAANLAVGSVHRDRQPPVPVRTTTMTNTIPSLTQCGLVTSPCTRLSYTFESNCHTGCGNPSL